MFFFDYFFSPVEYCLKPFIAIPTDNFSILPPEVLREVMKNLSVKDLQSLRFTNKKIEPIAKLAILAKPQENLEYILNRIINGRMELYAKCQPYFEKIKSLPNESEERLQVLRDAICFIFEKVDFWFVKRNMETLPFFEDKLLPRQIIKRANPLIGLCSPTHITDPNNSKRFKVDYKLMRLFLKMLKTNEISSSHLVLSFSKDYKSIHKIMEMVVRVFKSNQSIRHVKIALNSFGTLNFMPIFKAIIENPRIVNVCIQEGDRSNLPLSKWLTIDDTRFVIHLEDILSDRLDNPNRNFSCWRWDRR